MAQIKRITKKRGRKKKDRRKRLGTWINLKCPTEHYPDFINFLKLLGYENMEIKFHKDVFDELWRRFPRPRALRRPTITTPIVVKHNDEDDGDDHLWERIYVAAELTDSLNQERFRNYLVEHEGLELDGLKKLLSKRSFLSAQISNFQLQYVEQAED